VKDANDVPDLWILLRDGLPYLNAREATEVQLALAVSLYAHSKSTTTSNASTAAQEDERVKVRASRWVCAARRRGLVLHFVEHGVIVGD